MIDTKKLEELRQKYCREDGSASSGNWGHVGRPGQWGGSAKGGGAAFRMEKHKRSKGEVKIAYTSQAKERDRIKKDMKSPTKSIRERAARVAAQINMKTKHSVKWGDDFYVGFGSKAEVLAKAHKQDNEANRNILSDPKRAKRTWNKNTLNAVGTLETMSNARNSENETSGKVYGSGYKKGSKNFEDTKMEKERKESISKRKRGK